jgi:flagellar hook assembly protein FlgD
MDLASGKLVRTLVDTTMPGGLNRVSWNGKDSSGREVSSGIYFVKFSVPEAESTIRIMRLR